LLREAHKLKGCALRCSAQRVATTAAACETSTTDWGRQHSCWHDSSPSCRRRSEPSTCWLRLVRTRPQKAAIHAGRCVRGSGAAPTSTPTPLR
jgi:hypothetical protein